MSVTNQPPQETQRTGKSETFRPAAPLTLQAQVDTLWRDSMLAMPLVIGLGGGEIWILVVAFVVLFGGSKIPELMRGVGQGVRELKKGMNEVDDLKEEVTSDK